MFLSIWSVARLGLGQQHCDKMTRVVATDMQHAACHTHKAKHESELLYNALPSMSAAARTAPHRLTQRRSSSQASWQHLSPINA